MRFTELDNSRSNLTPSTTPYLGALHSHRFATIKWCVLFTLHHNVHCCDRVLIAPVATHILVASSSAFCTPHYLKPLLHLASTIPRPRPATTCRSPSATKYWKLTTKTIRGNSSYSGSSTTIQKSGSSKPHFRRSTTIFFMSSPRTTAGGPYTTLSTTRVKARKPSASFTTGAYQIACR